MDINVFRVDAVVFIHPAPRFAQDEHGVRFIDHQEAVVFIFKTDKLGHRGDIPVHAISSFNHDQDFFIAVAPTLQKLFESFVVIVGEGSGVRLGHPDTLRDGVVA